MILCDRMGHLVSDTSLEELHEFAQMIGMRRDWFQNKRLPHYDLMTERKRQAALRAGAVLVESKEIVRRMVRQEAANAPA